MLIENFQFQILIYNYSMYYCILTKTVLESFSYYYHMHQLFKFIVINIIKENNQYFKYYNLKCHNKYQEYLK